MSEQAVGINTRNADQYVAAFVASEQADGHNRIIQLTGITAGKIQVGSDSSSRAVSSNDSFDITTISGDILVGDNAWLSSYVLHSSSSGKCTITPILCDSGGAPIGVLSSKVSSVTIPLTSGSYYLSPCLSWNIMETGSWYVFMHVSSLSNGNQVVVDSYTF